MTLETILRTVLHAVAWSALVAFCGVVAGVGVRWMLRKLGDALSETVRRHGKWAAMVLTSIALVCGVAARKTNNVPPRLGNPRPPAVQECGTNEVALTENQLGARFALVRVETNTPWCSEKPEGAHENPNIRLRGAAEDYFNVVSSTNLPWRILFGGEVVDGLTISTTGVVLPKTSDSPRMTRERLADLKLNSPTSTLHSSLFTFHSSLGVLPEGKWDVLGSSNLASRVWWTRTPSNSIVVTWQNVLLNRDPAFPVSFQTELFPNGSFVYRYALSRLGLSVRSEAFSPTNALVGAFSNGHGETFDLSTLQPFNFSTFQLFWHALSPDDTPTGDRDGDGLSTAEEIFVHGTDPGLWDTDGDGIPDGAEIAAGTDPFSRDTDGDAFADGTDPAPLFATSRADADGDGLPDAWTEGWFGTNTVSAAADPNNDGIPNLAAFLAGVDPACACDGTFRAESGAASARLVAWEVFPAAFSFARPVALTNLAVRTFAVARTSPWQQLYVSACPNGALGWSSSDVSIRYALDGGPATNEVPASAGDSWRVPLGTDAVSRVTFVLSATGGAPSLSRPLFLLRWSPRVSLERDDAGEPLDMGAKAPLFLARRRAGTGRYEIPFSVSADGVPHTGGVDAGTAALLRLAPAPGLGIDAGRFVSDDPVWAELPPEGTNAPARVCCWEIDELRENAVDAGPRASRFDAPYPLSSSAARLAFHRRNRVEASDSATLTLLPEHPLVGFRPASVPRPLRLLAASSFSTNPPPENPTERRPPGTATPTFDDVDYPDGTVSVEPSGDEDDPTPPEEDDGGCGGGDEPACPCGDDDETSECSFRLKISLGRPAADELSGYLWTSLEEPTLVTPSVLGILASPGVSSVTNAAGEFTVSCADPGGRTVAVTNVAHGVAATVFNASGRLEAVWEITNPDGDAERVRCRRLTVLGGVTSDETFTLVDRMGYGGGVPDGSRVGDAEPDERVVSEDAIHGTFHIKRKWHADPSLPEFATDVHDERWLGLETRVSSVMSEFVRVGVGRLARRRLAHRHGYDENGSFDTVKTYWLDPAHPSRHARLRSVRSTRSPWSFHDWDAQGRETVRVEQLDGSPFPENLDAPPTNALPGGCSARVTFTSYEPPPGDSADRNDASLPRARTVRILRGSAAPVTVSEERWTYTRLADADGVSLRRCVHAIGSVVGAMIETTVSYPEDFSVPHDLRGRVVSSLGADGILTENAYSLTNGILVCTSRRSSLPSSQSNNPNNPKNLNNPNNPSIPQSNNPNNPKNLNNPNNPSIPQSNNPHPHPTYTVTISDAAHGDVLRRETRLAADDALLEWSESSYDDIHRLRSTTYSDGTSETNAYSCCRLLWTRDRETRRTLRSATTGTDDLYNAEEDVWLGEMENEEWRMEIGERAGETNRGFRVTQHFFDGLGRETNTVVCVAHTPGEAVDPDFVSHGVAAAPSPSRVLSRSTTEYPSGGSDCSIHTDERGKVTTTWKYAYEDCDVTIIETRTNDVWVSQETRTAYRNGATVTYRVSDCIVPSTMYLQSTTETRSTDYAADGTRVDTVVTQSSDCGTVTNSVTRYDLLGRVVSKTVPGANGALIETRSFYDGVSSRLVRTETDGEADVTYGYDELGDRIFTAQSGITNRTVTTYETVSGIVWRVTTATRLTATTANTVRVTKERLTGLSDACRGEVVTIDASGRVTVVRKVFDPTTGLTTETVRTDSVTPTMSRSRFGLTLEKTSLDEHAVHAYDAFGRVVETVVTHAGTEEAIRSEFYSYDLSGNVTTNAVAFSGTGTAVTASCFDMLNRETSRTDALGRSFLTTFDPLGRIVAVDGDQYPLRTDYDTAGRKTCSRTTRDGGATWDITCWMFDPLSGLNTSKRYADGSHVDYTYTDNGRQRRTTWARGVWREHAYNDRNLVSGTTYSSVDTPSVAYAYVDSGKLASASLSDGTSYAYSYDDRLLCTNEVATRSGGSALAVARSYDDYLRPSTTSVLITNVAHAAKTRFYDSENRVSGYALTNAAGRVVSVALAYDGSYLTNSVYALPNGNRFCVKLQRDPGRRNLITRRDYTFNGNSVYWYSTDFDLLARPTNAVDSISIVRTYLYNRRSELAAAQIGTNSYGYTYDTIGNRIWSSANTSTNGYTVNNLNQYSSISTLRASVSPCELSYDSDGNLVQDDRNLYSYDAENRLISVDPRFPVEGSFAVENRYNHKNLRVRKIVRRYTDGGWTDYATHDFTYDGGNIVLERITFVDGSTRTVEYFWGNDLSGTEQGAGGVGGLIAVSVDGAFFIPCYDHNGNIVCYVSESGAIAAQYVYDPYGNVIEQQGTLADVFSFGFSTKYHDHEVGLLGYQYRVLRPSLGRWLNRDPMGENGGDNLYAFCKNQTFLFDSLGLSAFSPRWVGEGVKNDGNNLWIAIWLWPVEPPERGVVIARLHIDSYSFTDCEGASISDDFWARDIETKNDFERSHFLPKYTPNRNDHAIYKSDREGGTFSNGLYFSLVDTSFKETVKGNNLKDCQKGNILMTFQHAIFQDVPEDLDAFNEPTPIDSSSNGSLFPFVPEASHKWYTTIPQDIPSAETLHLSVSWDWCGKDTKVVNKTGLPVGPNRKGR